MHLSTVEIARDLGITLRTAQKYCKTGFLPAEIKMKGSILTYLVQGREYLLWKEENFSNLKGKKADKRLSKTKELTVPEIENHKKEWLEWCLTGKLTGKPIAPRTAEIYSYYFDYFLKNLGKYPEKPIISISNLRKSLGEIAVTSFSTRSNLFMSVMSFAKYLIELGLLESSKREEFKKLKPRRFVPAKKTSLTEKQLNDLIKFIEAEPYYSVYDRSLAKTLVLFLANTGLRASEFSNLKIADVDFERRLVRVVLGKGNKNRVVGLSNQVFQELKDYLALRLTRHGFERDNFFLGRNGTPYNNQTLAKRLSRISTKVGIDITPHALRRTFVTLNANKGRPLNHLRLACGHSDITTTQGYLMTSIDEVIEAMKGW